VWRTVSDDVVVVFGTKCKSIVAVGLIAGA